MNMNLSSTNLKVGNVPLRADRVNAEFLDNMKQAALKAGAPEGSEQVAELLDKWSKEGEVSEKDLSGVQGFRKQVADVYYEGKQEFWKLFNAGKRGEELKPAEEKMGLAGEFLIHNAKLQTELREATARTAVQALAGTFVGPVGMVALYAAYANDSKWTAKSERETEGLINAYQEFLSGDHRMKTEGNDVDQVHREHLWHGINQILDKAIASGEAGKPVEMSLQYYELTSPEVLGKVAKAAEAGNKVRVNVDPGRLSYPEKDKEGKQYFAVDDIPNKMRTILQLANVPGADVGVSIYAVKQQLEDPTDLMHRKVLRVDNTVLLSGMNGNDGSGENLDSGYLIQGPAARALVDNLKRDIQDSKSAGIEEIWGEEHFADFHEKDLRMTGYGLSGMLDAFSGPTPAGQAAPRPEKFEDFEKLAQQAGTSLARLVDVPADQLKARIENAVSGSREPVPLTLEGKKMLTSVIQKAIDTTQKPENLARLDDISSPSGEAVGKTRVDIADLPIEREVMMLNAINQAEKFIYLPGFVLTRAVASAIVARRDALAAEGKELDVKIIADSGIYPSGDTPNSYGVTFLEDNGITPRWSKLTRTNHHDRKIHAKQLITDKGEMTGSTNFSKKGMRENWETSGYVHFEESDKDAIENRQQSVSQFMDLWENETFELNTKDLAAYNARYRPAVGKEWEIESGRTYAVKTTIKALEEYEIATAQVMGKLLEREDVRTQFETFQKEGYSEGDAKLMAAKKVVGKEEFYKQLAQLPEAKALDELKAKAESVKK